MSQNNFQGAWQKPVGSGFDASASTHDVIKGINLAGKTAIVTGGSTGIGLETAKVLAAAGATVILPARDTDKARKNLQGTHNVEVEHLDLMNPASIDAFAERFLASGRPLHLLINNAGIMWVPLRRDSRGFESQLATNYLALFHLTARLWTALKNANGARVVNLSSQGHQFAPFHFEDPNFAQREYETLAAYGQSKTAVNLFTVALDHRARNFGVRAYAVHPGNIAGTELGREATMEMFQKIGLVDDEGNFLPEVVASLKTIPQGAATTVWCATSPLLENIGGVYCEDCDIAELADGPGFSAGVRPYSLDEAKAAHLWEQSEQWANVQFNIQ